MRDKIRAADPQGLRDKIRAADPQAFYVAKKTADVNVTGLDPPKILEKLRQHGIGILSGEIEDLCQDGFVSCDNKMSLDKVFDLNSRISNGEKISDMFDVTELIEVLGAVLK